MKKILLSIALLATALCSQAQNHHGQTNKDIMDVAVKVNAYFMKRILTRHFRLSSSACAQAACGHAPYTTKD